MMPSVRVALIILGIAALPASLDHPPLGASVGVHHSAGLSTVDAEGPSAFALEVDPLVRVLVGQYSADPALAARIAVGLVREGHRTGIEARLLLAVLLVENPWLDPEIRSFVGAVGLMQVMPFHAGGWDCSGSDLTDPDVNICHGARILAHAIHRSDGDLDRALLRYNGCVSGTNTPDCHRYPEWVRNRLAQVNGELFVDD